MTAADFEPLLKRLAPRRVVFVNTASASGPFIEALSGPGRTIVTATRNGRGVVRDALRRLLRRRADLGRRRRGQEQAGQRARGVRLRRAREVATAYERQGIMLTEHALLDDSGDKEGTATPTADGKEGRVAALIVAGHRRTGRSAAGRPEAARALRGAARARAPRRIAEADERQHGRRAKYAGELEKLRDRPGAQDAADSRERRARSERRPLHAAARSPRSRCCWPSARRRAGAAAQDFFGGRRAAAARAGREQPLRRAADVRAAALQRWASAASAGGGEPPWAHDYPTADMHMMKILNELTLTAAAPRRVEHLVARRSGAAQLSDRLHVGAGLLDDERRRGRRGCAAYLSKGGFMIFDDFRGRDWDNLRSRCGWRSRRAVGAARRRRIRSSTRSSRSTIRTR